MDAEFVSGLYTLKCYICRLLINWRKKLRKQFEERKTVEEAVQVEG